MAKRGSSTSTRETARASGSPGESKSVQTRARILDAAARVLSTQGYAGTRLADVAALAKVQTPAIYYYFSSREDLIEEVMWVGVAEMRRHVGEALEQAPASSTAMDRIMIAVEQHLRHELQISDYATASIRNAGQLPTGIRDRPQAEATLYGDLWRSLIREAAQEGQIRAELDLHVAHMLVIGALNWAAEWWEPERGAMDALVAMTTSFVRGGLSPDGGPGA